MLGKLHNYLYNEEKNIRERMFVLNIINLSAILTLITVEMLILEPNWENILVIAGFIAVIILIGVISIKSEKINAGTTMLCFVMSFCFFPVIFINDGGITGTGSLWFIYDMILIIVLLYGRLRILFTVLLELLCLGCFIITYINPDIISVSTGLKSYIYSFTILFLLASSVAVMLIVENKLYIAQNERAKEQSREIEKLVASQNRFFSSMSHEIRTPINTIIGLNEMILRENLSDEITEDAVNIRAAGRMLLNTINDILDMSKFQSGDMHLVIDTYSTGDMLSDLVGMLWLRAKEKNLDFHVNVAPDIPAELKGDEMRIKQVLMNILNNAIKYTKTGSVSLSVECEKLSDGTVNMIYTVEDTGMGIKKEDIPYLFTAFKRVDESNTKHIEGTGLGLSIVKQFLDLMGGKVTVNSVYTKGSTFTVEIPQKATGDKELGEYDYRKKHKLARKSEYKQRFEAPDAKILVVDDNEANLLVVTKLLRDTKIQVDTVKSGKEALAKTLDVAYDLIFMDHLMPEMNGIECFREIRKQLGGKCRETNIVILTANAGEENRKLYAIEGFNGYLIKPITGDELENEVYRLLPKTLIHITSSEGVISEDNVSWQNLSHKKRIVITTESTCDLPAKLLARYDIKVFAQKVQTKDGVFREGEEIDTMGLLRYMEDKNNPVSPVMPSASDYEAFFAEQLKTANNVIHISITGSLPQSAYPIAKEGADSFDSVTVIDSKHISSAQGLVAVFASRMAEAGMGAAEIEHRLVRLKGLIKASFMVEDMEYMARSGQVSAGQAKFFKTLMLRPVTAMKNGAIESAGLIFGSRENAMKKYISHCLSSRKINHTVLFVNHVGLNRKEIEWIRAEIEKKYSFDAIYFQQTSPVVAISCGPGAFGITVVED